MDLQGSLSIQPPPAPGRVSAAQEGWQVSGPSDLNGWVHGWRAVGRRLGEDRVISV